MKSETLIVVLCFFAVIAGMSLHYHYNYGAASEDDQYILLSKNPPYKSFKRKQWDILNRYLKKIDELETRVKLLESTP